MNLGKRRDGINIPNIISYNNPNNRLECERIELNEYSEAERNRFFKLITPILVELSKEFGVSTLLDHRMVIISLNDITDHSLNQVNKIIGTGKDVNND